MRQQFKSPSYTTKWEELLVISNWKYTVLNIRSRPNLAVITLSQKPTHKRTNCRLDVFR
jgi:hypothetical protein